MQQSVSLAGTKAPIYDAGRVLIFCTVLWLLALAGAWYVNRVQILVLTAAVPIALVVLTNPRLAVYQFVFFLFVRWMVLPEMSVLLIDLSAAAVVGAAAFDLVLSDRLPGRIPTLALAYAALFAVLFIASVFSYDSSQAIRPMARIIVLGATFAGLYRLSGHMSIGSIIRAFFWLGVVHLAVSLAQFVMSGGVYRSFAFSGVVLDDLAMILLPIGMGLYLWTSRRTSLLYLAGTMIVLGGLIGTQSRAPIAIGVAATVFVMLVSWRRVSHRQHREPPIDMEHTRARRRIAGWLLMATGLIATVIAVWPDFFFAVANRFSNLFTLDPARTFSFRLYLWGKALLAFSENPLVGIGPGMFRQIGEIYTTTHLHPVAFHLHGMTAHNMLLHYLAETGILGGVVVLTIVVSQFRMSRRVWFSSWRQKPTDVALAVFAVGFVFLISSLVEAGWMWGGQAGYIGCLLLMIVARAYRQAGRDGIH